MNYAVAENSLRETYNQVAAKYRRDDEREIQTEDHQKLRSQLQRVTNFFERPLSVLEVGCGTGRYFYCLNNVRTLVGLDVSQEMLQLARTPVNAGKISAEEIRFVCGSFYRENFAPASFDFIYSLGVFGNGCVLTRDVCQRFFNWLKPDGFLFFDTFDLDAEPLAFRLKERLRGIVQTILPKVQEKKVPFFMPTRAELHRLVSGIFPSVTVRSIACQTVVGPGRKLQCLATKRPHIPRELLPHFA